MTTPAFLDMTPSTGTFTDGALLVGQSFVDSTYGVTFDVLAATPTLLTLRVQVGAGPVATTTTLTASPSPSDEGLAVTITSTVNGSNPGGSVTFKSNAATIGGCSAVALTGSGSSRTATCITSALAYGSHALTAEYGGDGGNLASSSTALMQWVRPRRYFHQGP